MNGDENIPPNRHGFFGWLAGIWDFFWSLPVMQEIAAFGRDVSRHYKLDAAVASVGDAKREVMGDYKASPKGTRNFVRTCIILVVVFVIGAILYQAYTNPDIARPLHLPMPADGRRAKMMDLTEISGGGGQVQQSATVNLSSWIVGLVTNVPVNLGDIVTPDTVLYECDPAPLQATLDSATEKEKNLEYAETISEKQEDGTQKMLKQGLASEADVLTSESSLALARSNLASAKQEMLTAKVNLEQSAKVKSPVKGIVLNRMVNPGERIMLSQVLVSIGNLEDVYFLANVSEDKIGAVAVGLDAEVVFESFPGEIFKGKVFFIDPKTNPSTRSFTVYVKIHNPDMKLKPGISGFARITQQKHILAVPDTALMNPVGGSANVFVITDDHHAVLRPVHFGMVTQGWAEIDDGVKEGEIVATVGPLYLKDGDYVHYNLEGE